ncbi:MMPL family transporter [Cohnella cellulosilytica]|uniref:MMPL family transporter n=1 Tax=Cohnella cellulosilytica TaxID=986710 RepID=A0ABW2F640_9BACL
MEKWTRAIARFRWVVLTAWLAAALLSLFALPDLQSILRHSEQRFLPSGADSVQATRLLQNIAPEQRSLSEAVLVFSREEGLSESDDAWMDRVLAEIGDRASELRVTSVVSALSQPELAERLRSADGTTRLALLGMPSADFDQETQATLGRLESLLGSAPEGTQAILTGSAPLSQDFQRSAESGLRRTELLTIGLVLAILLMLFRSPVTPLLPLLTIGIGFVVSEGMLAAFASWKLPVSHFTESFLIAVLFGAGTDYCILLIQRYREELLSAGAEDGSRVEALVRTMAGVSGTIVYSAGTVFAAFLLLGFAEFGLYRSAVGVALGVLVTVAAALTLAPALLLAAGPAIFWPARRAPAGQPSRFWDRLASLAAKRTVLVLVVSVVCLAPLSLLFQGKRTFDDLSEIDPRLDSVVGFRQAEKAFSAGEVFPVTIAVTAKQSMRTTSGLAALEQVSSELERLPFVREVRSAVRPLGRKPEQLTVPGRLKGPDVGKLVQSLMGEQRMLLDGLKEIALHSAPLSQGMLGILSSVKQLQDGLGRLLLSQLGSLDRLELANPGPNDGAASAAEQALDYYIAPDGRTAKFELLLVPHPYSDEAMDAIPELARFARTSMEKTWLEEPRAFVTGVTAKYGELRDISWRDFARTGLLVLAGIAAVLALLLRSLLQPLCILLSLGLNYLIAMGILEFVFVRVLGYAGLSWTVSFFVFIIIVALGVDYSIFLMARFKEEARRSGTADAMAASLSATGGIVRSAAVIMAGTFGALTFSGMDTLVQIGSGALIGLLLYATLFMGLIVPALIHLTGRKRGPRRSRTG